MSEHGTNQDGGNVDPLVGKVLSGRFALEALLSRGGMGKVYRAVQRPLDRTVALKILDVADGGGEFRRRFFMEASLCAKLTHPHTVRIYDYGATDDGIFFIAMEYLQGRTLHDMLQQEAPIAPHRALAIARGVCGALAEAHDAGIVHRDMKPSNVILVRHEDEREFPKVIDFGLVKELGKESDVSQTGHVLGSPMYMAPEQVEGRAVDARTDVYAIGLILYYALSGQTAVPRGNPMAVLMAQVQRVAPTFAEADPDLQVPPCVEWLVRTAIEKRMDDRFASMHELLRALKVCERVVRGELPDTTRMSLENGRVVLPEGLDISEEIRVSAIPRSTSLPPPILATGPSDTTLGGREAPIAPAESSRSQVGLLVAGSAVSAVVAAVSVLVLVGVVALGVWMAWSPEEPAAVVVPVPLVPEKVTVTLTSQPDGVEIEQDGVLLGRTPYAFPLEPDTAPFDVTLKADGYVARVVRISPDQPEVTAALSPLPPEPSPAPAPKPPPQPKGGGNDFRDRR